MTTTDVLNAAAQIAAIAVGVTVCFYIPVALLVLVMTRRFFRWRDKRRTLRDARRMTGRRRDDW